MMVSFYKSILILILTTLCSAMVVRCESSSSSVPIVNVGKHSQQLSQLVSRIGSYGLLENRICLQKSCKTQWSKKFLAKREANPHSAPYVVSIQMMTPNGGLTHYCAGTIINEHWILTAAHCLGSHQQIQNSVIVAGCHDIHSSDESARVQIRKIDYYVQHELYLGGVNPYDIALIYTREPFQFTDYVQPAELPEQDSLPEGYGTLYGWGNVSMTAVPNYPHKLQQAHMPILDMELCEQILASSGYTLHETNLCTGPLSGGVSICTADSGGPLIQEGGNYYSSTIIGIVSWGKMPCGQKNAPSVFVRVSAFTDWIQQIIETATHIQ